MFGFIKRCTFSRLAFLLTLTGVNMLGCTSMNNQECRISSRVLILMGMIRYFFPFSIKTSKCSGSCDNINNPNAKLCVPVIVKKLNVKVFNLMSRTNEIRYIDGMKF